MRESWKLKIINEWIIKKSIDSIPVMISDDDYEIDLGGDNKI